jgi:DNA-binding transcriptional ArsR family regulator
METTKTVNAMMHPVRLRILQTLGSEALTTQEIAERMSDTPKSSIYRHLKVLLEADLVAVAATRLVKGIEEKRYVVARSLFLDADDIAGMSGEDHVRSFTTYMLLVQQGFVDYVRDSADNDDRIDMVRDRAGYTEIHFHATDAELDAAMTAINQAVLPLIDNQPDENRRARKLITVSHPIQ